ncbi:Transposase, MuDR, plant [Sesbania bispinosa]|nr:Transposase, MuDR, plant [Sesbania bispinosa]
MGDVVISETHDEWKGGDEGEETDSDHSYLDEEERQQENSNNELSDYEEQHDLILSDNSDDDKVPIYFDRALRDFVIQEGFEIKRIKNEKARVTARWASNGCGWRIHASPTPDGKTYKIKI